MTDVHARLAEIEARFDQRFNDRKTLLTAVRAVLDLCDKSEPDLRNEGAVSIAKVREAVSGVLAGPTPEEEGTG